MENLNIQQNYNSFKKIIQLDNLIFLSFRNKLFKIYHINKLKGNQNNKSHIFKEKNQQKMLKIFFQYISLMHAILIIYLTLQIYNIPISLSQLNLKLAILQTILSFINILFTKKITFMNLNLFFSISLYYNYFSKNYKYLSCLFLLKIFFVNNVLKNSQKLIFSGDNCKVCKLGTIIYNFVRFIIVEYMFLGIIVMIYKFIVYSYDKSGIQIPENYRLFYQMIVTATTIGYGDVCPKSRIQINFFIAAISFICGSFVIFSNNASPLWDQLVQFLSSKQVKDKKIIKSQIPLKSQEQKNVQEFVLLSSEKTKQNQFLRSSHFNDWISLAIINYESQINLINTITQGHSYPKQIILQIGSKIRQQYFPKKWIILNGQDINQNLYMIHQGQISVNGIKKEKGFVFNQKGFYLKNSSRQVIYTLSFVTLLVISLNELEQISLKCPLFDANIQQKILKYEQAQFLQISK